MSSRMHAMERESIRVTRSVSAARLPEIELRVSRSSGPGGQHAQKSSTRVEALLDVEASSALTEVQKRRVVDRVGPVVRAVAQDERSQLRNRELAIERLVEKLRAALAVPRTARTDETDRSGRQAQARRETAPSADEAAAATTHRRLASALPGEETSRLCSDRAGTKLSRSDDEPVPPWRAEESTKWLNAIRSRPALTYDRAAWTSSPSS